MGEPAELPAVMAGSGKPWSVLTEQRKNILMKLHVGSGIDAVAQELGVSYDELIAELQPLIEGVSKT